MDERLKKLRKQVDELLEWKRANSRQQIRVNSYNIRSKKVMQKDHLVVTGLTQPSIILLDLVSLEIKVGDDTVLLPAAISP